MSALCFPRLLYVCMLSALLFRRKLAGLAPQLAEVGDQIAVLLGCDFPVVLREVDGRCELIGEVYVESIMDGKQWTTSILENTKRDISKFISFSGYPKY